MQQVAPGVWKLTLGTPEQVTPVAMRHRPPALEALEQLDSPACPFAPDQIYGQATSRGFELHIGAGDDEQFFGLGLQLKSVAQRVKEKMLRVNSDPTADTGDSHAPVPFYVSTAGYGVLVDTARYATFHMASALQRGGGMTDSESLRAVSSAEELYAMQKRVVGGHVIVEVPYAKGVDVYVFAGPDMGQAVQRYNLFSGRPCLPPRWGLGVWYRPRNTFTQEEATALARSMRQDRMPCDVYGLEGGWQSHTYSCTWQWANTWPQPRQFVGEMSELGYKVNLWTHIFVHPTNPMRAELEEFSGNFLVWNGLVPDLTLPQVRAKIADFHDREHIDLGVSGYKADECDNSDFVFPWSFPDTSRFPSGLDGEQMHCRLGLEYQELLESIFRKRNVRTFSQVRSSHALAAPYPFVLYSDLYDHRDFIRGVLTSSFSGLLWSPEVRDAVSSEDLLRRLQSVVLSPQALINAWYITNPPWKQWKVNENNDGQFAEGYEQLQATCREILNLRMRLIPYIQAAFFRYHLTGRPAFRALAMDWPTDVATHAVDDQWMIGENLMAAPVTAGQSSRNVYLPAGQWVDFFAGQRYEGSQTISMDVPLDRTVLLVKTPCVLPLAVPTLHTGEEASRHLEVQVFGQGDCSLDLLEDDDRSYDYEQGRYNVLSLAWRQGKGAATRKGEGKYPQYVVDAWVQR